MGEAEEVVKPKDYEINCFCGKSMMLRKSKWGWFYGCRSYPDCEGSIGAHQATGEPLGIPAPKEVRMARVWAHNAFDQLWMGGPINLKRTEAYAWMREKMELSEEEAHIGRMDEFQCFRLIGLVKEEFEKRNLPLLDKVPPKERREHAEDWKLGDSKRDLREASEDGHGDANPSHPPDAASSDVPKDTL